MEDLRNSKTTLKTKWFLMIFQGSGGQNWLHFPLFFGCLFRDRFLIVLGSVLGSIWDPFGLPTGVYVEGFGGSGLVSILGWFLGESGTLLKFKVGQKVVAIYTQIGALRQQNRLLIFEHRSLNEGQ